MKLKNKTLIQEIEYWESKSPHLESFFKLRTIEGFLVFADIIPDKDKYQTLIIAYVSGLIDLFLYVQTKKNEYFDEFDLKTKGFFKVITNILNSENYQNNLVDKSIPVSRVLKLDGINLNIKDEIKCYIQRIHAIPLTSKDLDSIELELIEFSRKKYQKQKPQENEIVNDSIVTTIDADKWDAEEIYRQFNGVLFKCDKYVFNDWFVTGVGNVKKPVIKDLRQLYGLLQRISTNPKGAKMTYFKTVFNQKYKSNEVQKIEFDVQNKTKLNQCKK